MKRKQAITAKDIAAACGVSQATVSYVLNNKPGKKIGADTRTAILETAHRLGYIPSATARSMRTSRAMSIGIVSGGNSINIGFNHALRGIKSCLDQAGYSILLLNSEGSEPEETEYIRAYCSGRIDGVLFLFCDQQDSVVELLDQRQIPWLSVNENGVAASGTERPHAFEHAVQQAAEFCRERKYRNIRFFSLKYGDTLYSYKYDLFADALEEVYPEASLRRIIIQSENLTNEDLKERLSGYLAAEDFQLSVTPNQRLGWLMQSCILERDFFLPQKIKHICLASSHVFHLTYPTVTSIDIPLTAMGEFAARQLVRILEGESLEEQEFSCVLKEGDSTL